MKTPLPEPVAELICWTDYDETQVALVQKEGIKNTKPGVYDLVTASQMREYGAAIREECAKICEGFDELHPEAAFHRCATAIRGNHEKVEVPTA